jgi:hypothetical protein
MPSDYDDRRESQRIPFTFRVREKGASGSFEERAGNLSLGGVYYTGTQPPTGTAVELRFSIPGHAHEVAAEGEVLRVSRTNELFGSHIRFTEIPLDCELALARFFQSLSAAGVK